MSEWIEWTEEDRKKGKVPVPVVPGSIVAVELSAGDIITEDTEYLNWGKIDDFPDREIVSYRIDRYGKENDLTKKDTNPKDAVGSGKFAMSTVPETVLAEISVGMLEGARKYGRHNYRVAGVRGSIYYDAAKRHLQKWWSGEDIDQDTFDHETQDESYGLSHITKAICSLIVLRDAMINDKFTDDRPPKIPTNFWNDVQRKVDGVMVRYPDAKPAFIEGDQYK